MQPVSNLDRFQQLREYDMGAGYQAPQADYGQEIASIGNAQNQMFEQMSAMKRASGQDLTNAHIQGSVLPTNAPVTQAFGNYNPGLYSGINKSMRNTGTDLGVKEGTPLALPPGEWQVVEAYSGANSGGKGNKSNKGYGNSVMAKNTQTGEILRFSHLSGVNVQPGNIYKGGTILGASGSTGNATGPHLDLEYQDALGQYKDVLASQYGKYLFGSGGGGGTNGKGGGFDLEGLKKKVSEVLSGFGQETTKEANLMGERQDRYGLPAASGYQLAKQPILQNIDYRSIQKKLADNNIPGQSLVGKIADFQESSPVYQVNQKMEMGAPLSPQESSLMADQGVQAVAGLIAAPGRPAVSPRANKVHPEDLAIMREFADTIRYQGDKSELGELGVSAQRLAKHYLGGDWATANNKQLAQAFEWAIDLNEHIPASQRGQLPTLYSSRGARQ